jgi:hypothetical protein
MSKDEKKVVDLNFDLKLLATMFNCIIGAKTFILFDAENVQKCTSKIIVRV